MIKLSKELLLEISYNCNYNCLHCSSVNCPGEIKLSDLDKYRFIIDEVDTVRISGGEALLNDDLIDYVEYFYDRGLDVILQTNGSMEIPVGIYNRLYKIYLSLFSNYERQSLITGNIFSFDKCIEMIENYSNVVLCSPIFSLEDSINLIAIARQYDLPVRFTSLLNHGRCGLEEQLEEQIKIYNLIRHQWDKIIPHCSLTGECEMENKYVIKPDSSVLKCASTKQGKRMCKNTRR